MPRLGRRSRAALSLAAFGAFAAAYVTTPIAARSAADWRPAIAPLPEPAHEPPPFAVVLPRRDPFAGAPDAAAAGSTRSEDARLSYSLPRDVPSAAPWPHALEPLPPNAGAPAASPPFPVPVAAQPLSARITALVTGAHPYALVDDGGTTRLVTLGDRIGDAIVAAISAAGVRLADGRTLPLVTAAPVPFAPPAPPASKGR